MRLRSLYSIILTGLLAAPAAASAAYPHTVLPGESLSSIAAVDGLTVSQLAAANGLASDSSLIAGTTLEIPPQGPSAGSYAAVATTTVPVSTGVAATNGSASGDSYVVQPGDTLWAIAARVGISVAQLAADNGLNPNGVLPAGSVIGFGDGASGGTAVPVTTVSQTASAEEQPVGAAAEGNVDDPPYPTAESVSATEIAQIASANGVPPALAEAVGWQESGFNNDLVSTADARGVMQILPGTWNWIQNTLTAGSPLAPASAADNVRGGVLLLHWLLDATGSNQPLAAADYYQGLGSVEQDGIYPSTQQYVNSVLALEQQFGGG